MKNFEGKKVVFAVGTGRCGTKFLQQILAQESGVSSHHERAPLNDTFHRYFKWYGLDIDSAGFLHHKIEAINEDFLDRNISFEASSYLSFSIIELFSKIDASFVLLVRDPVKTCESYYRKGYYSEPFYRDNPDLPPSCQQVKKFHHFLGRILPNGKDYSKWINISRIAKIGWFWNTVNSRIVEQFSQLPPEKSMTIRLEDFDYERYLLFSEWVGFKPILNEKSFLRIANKRPNTNKKKASLEYSWTERDCLDFSRIVAPMSKHFNYPYEYENLRARLVHKQSV